MELNNMLAILIIFGALPLARGLKCYVCTHIESSLTERLEKPVCRDGDTTKMTSVRCPHGSACFKIEGEYSSKDASGEGTLRECLGYRGLDHLGVNASSTLCKPMKDASFLSEKFGIKLDTFEGTACVCTTDNCNGQSMAAPAIFTFVISLVMVIFVSL